MWLRLNWFCIERNGRCWHISAAQYAGYNNIELINNTLYHVTG
jgi:hypothetical protein